MAQGYSSARYVSCSSEATAYPAAVTAKNPNQVLFRTSKSFGQDGQYLSFAKTCQLRADALKTAPEKKITLQGTWTNIRMRRRFQPSQFLGFHWKCRKDRVDVRLQEINSMVLTNAPVFISGRFHGL